MVYTGYNNVGILLIKYFLHWDFIYSVVYTGNPGLV